ncbi:MAG: type I-E CRISPR-associated protein Cas6/Cse3/CasE [Anaerolineae bacterium]
MYLSQLLLNPRFRAVQADLADRYQLHRTVLSGFDHDVEAGERVLYRLEVTLRRPLLLVQSVMQPQWQLSPRIMQPGYLLSDVAVKPVQLALKEGQILRFRLYANPTVKRGGKRYALHTEEQQRAWLQRKAVDHGFEVLDVSTRDVRQILGRHNKQRLTWHQVGYEGYIVVRNAEQLLAAVQQGIGSAKAFGFGLLSLAPADSALQRG